MPPLSRLVVLAIATSTSTDWLANVASSDGFLTDDQDPEKAIFTNSTGLQGVHFSWSVPFKDSSMAPETIFAASQTSIDPQTISSCHLTRPPCEHHGPFSTYDSEILQFSANEPISAPLWPLEPPLDDIWYKPELWGLRLTDIQPNPPNLVPEARLFPLTTLRSSPDNRLHTHTEFPLVGASLLDQVAIFWALETV